jgi:hypothetical protein
MNGASEKFLAGAGFTGYQNVDVARSDAFGEGEKFLHAWGTAEKTVKTAAAIFKRAKVAEFAFGGSDAISATAEEAELHDVGRVGNGIGGTFFDGAQEEAAIFGVTQNEHRRVGGLGVDIVEKTETDSFCLVIRMAQVKEDHVRPGEHFLKLIHAIAAVGAQGEAVAERAGNRFA